MFTASRLRNEVTIELKKDLLNPKVFFFKKAYGKVIHYDETTYAKGLTRKQVKNFLEKIKSLVDEYFIRNEKIDKYNLLQIDGYAATRHIEWIMANPNVDELIVEYVSKRKMSILKAHELAYKLTFDNAKHVDFKNFRDKHLDMLSIRFGEFVSSLPSMIHRVYLEHLNESQHEDFILVIDRFIPEIFFKPSPHLKGIIYRKDEDQVKFNHFAMQYQIPIVKTIDVLKGIDYLLIDIEKGTAILPNQDQVNQYYIEHLLSNDRCYIDNPYRNTRFKIHAMISNYLDIDIIQHRPLFETTVLYNTEVVVAAKGSALTYAEWLERLEYIFKKFKGKEVFVRIPTFKQWMTTPELEGIDPFDILQDYPDYIEDLMDAISTVGNSYPEKSIRVLVPNLGSKTEYDHWEFHLKCMVEDKSKHNNIRMIYEYNKLSSMYDMDEDLHHYDFVINLDLLAPSYEKDLLITKDHVDLKLLRDLNIYDDLQHTRYLLKVKSYIPRELLMGHCLQEQSVFHRMIITGYSEYIIPAHTTNHIYDIIENYLRRRGKFVGVYHEDLKRAEFNRKKKKEAGKVKTGKDSDYKTHLEEKRKLEEKVKKLKESKIKKESDDSSKEDK